MAPFELFRWTFIVFGWFDIFSASLDFSAEMLVRKVFFLALLALFGAVPSKFTAFAVDRVDTVQFFFTFQAKFAFF
jgi:hypothetical protein